jgi:hypothetical protein
MRQFVLLLLALLAATAAGCNGGNEKVATQPPPTTTAPATEATLKQAIRTTLNENRRLSIYVLWNNRIPPWAERSTRGPALASLRTAAQNRRNRGVRVRMLEGGREIRSVQLEPSYTRATAIVIDRQRVQPSRRNGRPIGRVVVLNERARYELRRIGQSNRFVVWRVVLLD